MAVNDTDKAIHLVSAKNETMNKGWAKRALDSIKTFPGDKFITEELRDHAYNEGLEKPHDDRAWGAVLRSAQKSGLIFNVGYAPAPKAHGRPCVLWKRNFSVASVNTDMAMSA